MDGKDWRQRIQCTQDIESKGSYDYEQLGEI